MKQVLEDFYFGEIQPNIRSHSSNPRLKKCSQTINENEEILLKLLEGKERKLFLDFVDAQSEVEGTSAVENFINGFKLGVRMIVESIVEL